ncbi:MAG: hypothetical protein PHN72_06035 [Bacilli bacterium]|nr:hypothetical protein [Bacilli bacterium]
MKKHNILKVLGISFLVVTLLTWLIPAGSYSSGSFASSGTTPFGLFDLTRIPLIAITNLVQYTVVILVIGGLYGVLNKTGVYATIVGNVAKKFKKKETRFVLISILVFAILSSVSGSNFAIFALVPFFVAIILLLGFNKVTAMLATIGSMLLGTMAATFNTEVAVAMKQYFSLDLTSSVVSKIVLFVVLVVLYTLFVLKIAKTKEVTKKETVKKVAKEKAKKETATKTKKSTTKAEAKGKKEVLSVKEEVEIPLYDAKAVDKKKSNVPLIVCTCVMIVISLVAMFNWTTLLNIKFFDTIYESVMGIKIGDYTIVKNLLGTLSPFGYWTNYEFVMFILLCIPFIAWLYNIKMDEVIDGFISGAKQVLKPAIYVLFASILYASMFSNQSGANIFYTIVNFFLGLSANFNALVVGAISLIGGFLFSDFSAFIGSVATPITSTYANATMYPIMTLIIQSIYGLVMFITPSSMLLVLGLSYFDISYKDWFKTIWKYLVKVLIVIILVVVIASMFI